MLTRQRSYPTEDAPLYHTGAAISLTAATWMACTGVVLSFYVIYANRRKGRILASLESEHVVSRLAAFLSAQADVLSVHSSLQALLLTQIVSPVSSSICQKAVD